MRAARRGGRSTANALTTSAPRERSYVTTFARADNCSRLARSAARSSAEHLSRVGSSARAPSGLKLAMRPGDVRELPAALV